MIKLLPLSDNEAAELRQVCGDGTLQKAAITLTNPDNSIPPVVYLDVKWFEWRSTIMEGFPGTYRMEVRFVDEIEIQVKR
ncbi:MAG: hypothetical protein NTW10_04085 [Bacteroidetes bacterium]|nr:hypothetical protein [Bacteroidota bacterium]